MVRTPGFVLPSSFSSMEELQKDLKRRADESGFLPFDPADFLNEVDFFHEEEASDEFLEHYGIKGMKWGKRAPVKKVTESRSTKLTSGDKLELSGDKTPLTARVLAAMIPSLRRRIDASDNFTLKNAKGEKVGNMFLHKKAADELNVVWVEVKDKHKGQGIATGAMRAAIDMAKQDGLKKVTLEVPGASPDARHIYEKLGFKAGKQITPDNDMWGGLTEMQLDL
jgi:GNAT superfamily N-acetyltransferase